MLQAALGATCLLAALAAYLTLQSRFRHVREPPVRRKGDRLAVGAVACFLWPAVALLALSRLQSSVGLATQLTVLAVLAYLVLDVRVVTQYVGLLCEYQGGETLAERATQISTAAFAAGTLLLSTGGQDVVRRVAPLVFLALLLCVLSALATSNARRGGTKRAVWEAAQRTAVAFAAGLLALAIAVCVDVRLKDPIVT